MPRQGAGRKPGTNGDSGDSPFSEGYAFLISILIDILIKKDSRSWRRRGRGKVPVGNRAPTAIAGALCLSIGMCLAIAYGWRPFFPLDFLSIPWMYAVHGTLNFLGVGLLVIGWWFFDRRSSRA